MLERREYSPSSSLDQFPTTNMIQKKKSKNKRRFSDEQIKSLESIFESESKLEPIKKLELAKELGLQPRQVAIWFQNRRARWKSKQLERDYSILKANYDNLATRFESLKKEKQSLVIQLKKLNDQIGNPRDNSTDEGDSENGDDMEEFNRKLNNLLSDGSDLRVISSSNNGNSENNEYFRHGHEDESELMNMVEPVDGVLTSPENWCSFESSGMFDQPCSSSSPQWWDYWSCEK